MKKLIYILFVLCIVACKQNEAMKKDDVNTHALSNFKTSTMTSEDISSRKLEEYIDLITLQQKHPEFESDINEQLKNFTNGKLSLNYPKGFKISDIKQLGESKIISDSLEHLILEFTVTNNSQTLKDSILAEIRSTSIDMDGEIRISKKVRFLNFE
ncbi:hypothetical protein A9Q86_05555 [Flavobacteriales bacterium 33_180_T64]|nr:hypothetical protein A9Q86_05555 [Flavobacteriales bacterium 33_180_T64]